MMESNGIDLRINDFQKLLRLSKWALIIRGILLLLLAGFFLFRPFQTEMAVTVVLGIYILLEGIALFAAAGRFRGTALAMTLINAAMLVLLGIFAIAAPWLTAVLFITIIGVWLIFGGMEYLLLPAPARTGRTLAIAAGILSVITGLLFLISPFAAALTLGWVLATLLLISALALIALGTAVR